ncbi:MAG TPA: hypothetical protein VFH90_05650 [Candidatus Limnocylindria bacterium]|nr:hypothetical protein [Candidatus Limnocylindria bacterium]
MSIRRIAAIATLLTLTACAATPSASPTASAAEVANGPLEPGTYTASDFSPRIEVTVPERWENFHTDPRFWDIVRVTDDGPIVLLVQQPTIVFGPPEGGSATTPEEGMALLRQNSGLTVSEAEPIQIGGQDGLVVDIAATEEDTQVFAGERPLLGIGPTDSIRVALFAVDEGLLIIGFISPAGQMQAALNELQPMVDSIRIGG